MDLLHHGGERRRRGQIGRVVGQVVLSMYPESIQVGRRWFWVWWWGEGGQSFEV